MRYGVDQNVRSMLESEESFYPLVEMGIKLLSVAKHILHGGNTYGEEYQVVIRRVTWVYGRKEYILCVQSSSSAHCKT